MNRPDLTRLWRADTRSHPWSLSHALGPPGEPASKRIVFGARNQPEAIAWRADAIELLDQWDRGGAQ